MQPDIALEALRYFDRTELEGLQMHSRYLRDFITRYARSLPLREFRSVWVSRLHDYLRSLELGIDRDNSIRVTATDEPDYLEGRFRLINNSFVHRLTLSFPPEDCPFAHYLREKADDLHCHIGVLHLDYLMGEAEYGSEGEIDYALVDFLGAHLKPTTYMLSTDCEFRENYAMLFTHGVLRDYVKHLVYKFDKIPAPDCIFAELLGVDVVERCDIATEVDPRPWINKFIEMFKMAGRETDGVRSVTLLYNRFGEEADVPVDLGPFGQPWRTDVLRPNCEFIREWLRERRSNMLSPTESPVGQLFLFDNTRSSKKLELFAWTIKERTEFDSLHYAFLLRVVDM